MFLEDTRQVSTLSFDASIHDASIYSFTVSALQTRFPNVMPQYLSVFSTITFQIQEVAHEVAGVSTHLTHHYSGDTLGKSVYPLI